MLVLGAVDRLALKVSVNVFGGAFRVACQLVVLRLAPLCRELSAAVSAQKDQSWWCEDLRVWKRRPACSSHCRSIDENSNAIHTEARQ